MSPGTSSNFYSGMGFFSYNIGLKNDLSNLAEAKTIVCFWEGEVGVCCLLLRVNISASDRSWA